MKIKPAWVLVVFFLLTGSNVFSQDVIFFKNGTKDTALIVEIGEEEVAYKKFNRQEGPLYKVLKTEIVLIEYANGTIVTINNKSAPHAPQPLKRVPVVWKQNIISVNVFGAFIGNMHLGYERLNYKGNFGLRFNILSTMLSEVTDVSMLLSGFDFNFYPSAQRRISYYLGPAFRVGYVNYTQDIGREHKTAFGTLLFNNGLSFNPSEYFYMGLQLGAGLGLDDNSELVPYGYLMFNVGGKF